MSESELEEITEQKIVKNESSEQSNERAEGEMFENVWVKVELVEGDTAIQQNPMDDEDIEEVKPRMSKRKKRYPQRIARTLKCDHCDYTTIYKNCLQLHTLGHTDAKPLTCDLCDYETRYPTSLSRHVLIKHDYKNPEKEKTLPSYDCEHCSYSTHYKWNLNAHKRKHKEEKEFKCDKCPYTTSYKNNFIKHNRVHNKKDSLFKCDKCLFITKYEGHISRHLAQMHKEISESANKCDLCDFSTNLKWRLNIHKQRSKRKEVMKCLYCGFETFYMCENKKHKAQHFNEIYVAKTNEVDELFAPIPQHIQDAISVPVEEIHMPQNNEHYETEQDPYVDWNNITVLESNNKEKPFQCIKCTYNSKFKASVQRHFQRHHTGSNNRPYKCTNCDFSTKTKDQIALHNKRSQSEVKIFCPNCEFTTDYKCQFVLHQKLHYTNKCSACDYTCKSRYDINKHFATVHMGIGYKCRFCDYRTSRKESLQCHERIHVGSKPFKCPHCNDYNAIRKSLLVNHIRRYHSEFLNDAVTVINSGRIDSLKVKPSEVQEHNNTLTEYLNGSTSL